MSHSSVYKDFLQAYLPKRLTQRIKWNTLLPNKSNFILEENLRELHSGLVYACKLDNQASLYLLIEHQSTPDPTIATRMLRYSHAIMNYHLQQGHKRFPTVAGICLYAGRKGSYPDSVHIGDYFEDPESADEVHGVERAKFITLVDITQHTQTVLAQRGQAGLIELVLKQGQKREFLNWIKAHPEPVRNLVESDYGHLAILYILAIDQKNNAEELLEAIASMAPQKKTTVMSVAQKLVEESLGRGMEIGMQRGIEEGMEKGVERGMEKRTFEIARNMLYNPGLGVDVVMQATGLSEKQILDMEAS